MEETPDWTPAYWLDRHHHHHRVAINHYIQNLCSCYNFPSLSLRIVSPLLKKILNPTRTGWVRVRSSRRLPPSLSFSLPRVNDVPPALGKTPANNQHFLFLSLPKMKQFHQANVFAFPSFNVNNEFWWPRQRNIYKRLGHEVDTCGGKLRCTRESFLNKQVDRKFVLDEAKKAAGCCYPRRRSLAL